MDDNEDRYHEIALDDTALRPVPMRRCSFAQRLIAPCFLVLVLAVIVTVSSSLGAAVTAADSTNLLGLGFASMRGQHALAAPSTNLGHLKRSVAATRPSLGGRLAESGYSLTDQRGLTFGRSVTAEQLDVGKAATPASTIEVDALIIGGGPVGLMLALGLLQKGLKVLVVEKSRTVTENWSTAYSYRIDLRGIALFEELGMLPQLQAAAVPSEGLLNTAWHTDGSFENRTGPTAISLGYWIQRPILMKLLEGALPAGVLLEGDLKDIKLGSGSLAEANVQVGSSSTIVTSGLVFGCDGSRSQVRETLAKQSDELAQYFTPHVLKTQSTGLLYKAVLYNPPGDLINSTTYVIHGKSGLTLGLLPFAGKSGEARPLSWLAFPDHNLHSFTTPEEVYRYLDNDFPQMKARERLPPGSAEAWCRSGEGSTLPQARWTDRASTWIGGTGVALLGDSLHSFPPDLGQGVNAGLSDVSSLLSLWPEGAFERAAVQQTLEAFNDKQAPEAEAICKLLPLGFPYQYRTLPNDFTKFAFLGEFILRFAANKLMPVLFTPPVVFQITSAPPLKYTDILQSHYQNTHRLLLLGAIAFSIVIKIVAAIIFPATITAVA